MCASFHEIVIGPTYYSWNHNERTVTNEPTNKHASIAVFSISDDHCFLHQIPYSGLYSTIASQLEYYPTAGFCHPSTAYRIVWFMCIVLITRTIAVTLIFSQCIVFWLCIVLCVLFMFMHGLFVLIVLVGIAFYVCLLYSCNCVWLPHWNKCYLTRLDLAEVTKCHTLVSAT